MIMFIICVLFQICFFCHVSQASNAFHDRHIRDAVDPTSYTYVPLENDKRSLDIINSYWPLNENAFIADFDSQQATRWAIIACEAKSENENNSGILDHAEALDEIDALRHYVDEQHSVKRGQNDIRFANVCLSYISPETNSSVCRYPQVDLNILQTSQWQGSIAADYIKPTRYPRVGDAGLPLGIRAMSGMHLGGVELNQTTGDLESVRSIAFRYFFRRTSRNGGDMDAMVNTWRNSLRDYILNKFMSSVIDVRYLDDEMMTKLKLGSRDSSGNLAAHLLDPTPDGLASSLWVNGLIGQLIVNTVPDLSRPNEQNRLLKMLAAFENTVYTFGEEGTVCWIRAFTAWRKWLSKNLYGQQSTMTKSDQKTLKDNTDQDTDFSPFGTFEKDLEVFLRNPYFPVYKHHVVLSDMNQEHSHDMGVSSVRAFRCFVTMKGLDDEGDRKLAVQSLKEIAARFPQYNMSVVAMDFFPPVSVSAGVKQNAYIVMYVLSMTFLVLFSKMYL